MVYKSSSRSVRTLGCSPGGVQEPTSSPLIAAAAALHVADLELDLAGAGEIVIH